MNFQAYLDGLLDLSLFEPCVLHTFEWFILSILSIHLSSSFMLMRFRTKHFGHIKFIYLNNLLAINCLKSKLSSYAVYIVRQSIFWLTLFIRSNTKNCLSNILRASESEVSKHSTWNCKFPIPSSTQLIIAIKLSHNFIRYRRIHQPRLILLININ